MFLARRARSAHQRSTTLERQYAFHRGEALLAGLRGSHDKAAGHSGRALLISRELYAEAADPSRRAPVLAAALCMHARYSGTGQSVALLTEAAGHYAALAAADPAAYEVPRIDVLTRVALAADAAGSAGDAIRLLREVTALYRAAPAADAAARDLALARARFDLGRCLLAAGQEAAGLAETEAGLALAATAAARLRVPVAAPGWLAGAPGKVKLVAPDWAAAAARAMSRHAAAGRWPQAAAAARTALGVSAGLAELGGDMLRDAHEALREHAAPVLAQAGRQGAPAGGHETPRPHCGRRAATGRRGETAPRSG